MPSASSNQRKAAGMAVAIKRGKMRAAPGTPSASMSQMPIGKLDEFARAPRGPVPIRAKKRYK